MNLEKKLQERSGAKCELCSSNEGLQTYQASPKEGEDGAVFICATCIEQMDDPAKVNVNHWRCLNDSMWSEVPAVQVLAHRMLTRLRGEGWAQDLLDMLYLDEDTLAWAKDVEEVEEKVVHVDCNGVVLTAGDSVVLIKDLKVKGASFIAKRGVAVRRISLVADNAGHIEGKIDGQHIVILTEFVKKSK